MCRFFIYALVDPRSGQWRYIGKTSSGMRRPRAHKQECSLKQENYKTHWIRQLKAAGLSYEIEILETLPNAERLAEAEQEWIAAARAAWVPLTNLTDGGEGSMGYRPTAATLQRLRDSHLGKKNPHKGIAKSAATLAKWMISMQKYRQHSETTKAKLSAAAKRRMNTPEGKAQLALAVDASREKSAETRAKISASLRSYHSKKVIQHG